MNIRFALIKIIRRSGKFLKRILGFPRYCIMSMHARYYHREQTSYQDQLSIVAIAKNERDYIREWAAYYRENFGRGVERIYLFDNESTDNMKEEIQDFIDEGFVVYETIKGTGMQYKAYNRAIKKYKNRTKYMAFVDCDEFLMSCAREGGLVQIIDGIFESVNGKSIGGIAVNWRMYGSSGYVQKPDGLVLENYLYRANEEGLGNACIKTIVNPRRVFRWENPHYPWYYMGFHSFDESGKRCKGPYNYNIKKCRKLRINHYFTKSKEEWIKRRSLGKADTKWVKQEKRTLDEFYAHDNNEIYDDIGLYWADRVRKYKEKKV